MEQKAAHTPAPWHFKKLAMHDGGHVVMFTAQNGQRTHRLDFAGEFKEADARLIAAAPDLLEIARAIVAVCDSGKHADMACMEGSPLVDAARAAIAKTTRRDSND